MKTLALIIRFDLVVAMLGIITTHASSKIRLRSAFQYSKLQLRVNPEYALRRQSMRHTDDIIVHWNDY